MWFIGAGGDIFTGALHNHPNQPEGYFLIFVRYPFLYSFSSIHQLHVMVLATGIKFKIMLGNLYIKYKKSNVEMSNEVTLI